MTDEMNVKRRDPRYTLRADRAFAEFEDPRDGVTRWSGRLITLSVAGLSIVVDARFPISSGTLLEGVTLQLGECRLHGDVETPSLVVERGAFFNGTTKMFRPEQLVRTRVEADANGPDASSPAPAP